MQSETSYDAPEGWDTPDYMRSLLGPEYLVADAGVGPVYGSSHGGTGQTRTGSHSLAPPPTLVGSSGGLEIDLIWDGSVGAAPSGFKQAIIDAATYLTSLYSNKAVINIEVGYGEIAGSRLAPGALGESESYGYLTNYSTVTQALGADGYAFSASNEPTGSQFFVTSAEAKGLGLVGGGTVGSSSLDGYVGFSTLSGTGYSWNYNANLSGSSSGTGPSQFDLEAVAEHEISEIMGRIGLEGQSFDGSQTYSPLDLYNYWSPGVLERSASGGYFSTDDGQTSLGTYNNAVRYGGDIADWASASSMTQSGTQGLIAGDYDAFDAFAFAGHNGDLTQSDVLELAALGYRLTPAGMAAA